MEAYTNNENPWLIEASDFPETGSIEEKLRFLIRYAILAPSVHNTQPWAFSVEGDTIRILADQNRCLRAADRDMRDMYLSLGCAIENLTIAAEHFGFHPAAHYLPEPQNLMLAATVTMSPDGRPAPSEVFGLFRAIPVRKTNHARFSPESISMHELHHLTACCIEEGVSVLLTSDDSKKRRFADLLMQADIIRFSDRQYVEELDYWVRQGAYDTPWMVKKLHVLASRCRNGEMPNDLEILKDAPVLGTVATEEDDRISQIVAGRVFERIFLRATSLGLSLEPITYVLQVPETKASVRNLMQDVERELNVETKQFPQVTFRIGYSMEEPHHSSRRPLEEVLVPLTSLNQGFQAAA